MNKMKLYNAYRKDDSAYLDMKCRLLAGRLGGAAAIFVFIAAYIYGITTYGVLLGVAAGWLPCGILAWVAANAINDIGLVCVRPILSMQQRLTRLLLQMDRLI